MQSRIIFFIIILLTAPQIAFLKTPNDSFVNQQKHLIQVGAFEAWEYSTGSESVVVAVVDTGVDIRHPDLINNIWINSGETEGDGIDNDGNGYIDDVHGWDFISNTADPSPKIDSGYNVGAVLHGTLVAGVIGAEGNNSQGVSGINWDVSIMSLRVLDHTGNGNSLIVRKALRYAIDNGADVINLSFVGTAFDGALDDIIDEAHSLGIAVVSAAGNEGEDNTVSDLDVAPHYPICHSGSVGVAGVDGFDKKASFSNYGMKCIDISAPGKQIYTTSYFQPALDDFRDFYTNVWSGTSFSAPIVSGAIALLKSYAPYSSPTDLAQILIETADNIDSTNPEYVGELGSGRLNIANAFKKLAEIKGNAVEEAPKRIYLPRVSTLTETGGVSKYATWSRSGDSQISQQLPFSFEFEKVAIADIDNDLVMEIIVGSAQGDKPYVTIYNTVTGEVENQFLAYDEGFTGGIHIAIGDIDGNGFKDIITVPASMGRGHVRVFNYKGNQFLDFTANDSAEVGGYTVAALELKNGRSDILLNKIGTDLLLRYNSVGNLVSTFFTGHPTPGNGLFIAAGDITGDAIPEILISARQGSPLVKVLSIDGITISSFLAYADKFRGGVSIGLTDATGDGLNNIITGAGPTGGPHVRTFNIEGELLGQFFADNENYTGGVIIAE